MKVARWGNSLAVRIPAGVAKQARLREGDEIAITPIDAATVEISRQLSHKEAMAVIRSARIRLPDGYKFDREAANARR